MLRISARPDAAKRAASARSRGLRRYGALAAVLAVPLSQLGHLLAYLLRYGPAGWSHESFGTHAYFPSVARTSAGLIGLLVLAAVAIVGVARLAAGARSAGRHRAPDASLTDILVVLVPLQLAIFTAQETAELVLAGHLSSLSDVPLLWGAAGQLPVACLGALFLRWASIAVVEAIDRLDVWLDLVVAPPPLLTASVAPARAGVVVATADGPTAGLQRGPPRRSRAP